MQTRTNYAFETARLSLNDFPVRNPRFKKLIQLGITKWIYDLPDGLRKRMLLSRSVSSVATLETYFGNGLEPLNVHSSDGHPFIFLHVPKTAGSSVVDALLHGESAGHLPAFQFLAYLGAKQYDKAFKFAFVRHPLSRAISAFNYLKSGGTTIQDMKFAHQNLVRFETFDAFVKLGLAKEPTILNYVHFRPQAYFLADLRTGHIAVDFLGRFESLGEDYALLANQLGITTTLPILNKGPRPDQEVTPEAVRTIERIYDMDYALFGYSKAAESL